MGISYNRREFLYKENKIMRGNSKRRSKRENRKLVKIVLTEDFYVPGEDVILEPGDTIYVDPYTEEGGQNPPETNVSAIDNPEADIRQAGDGSFTEDELDWVDSDDIIEGDGDCWTDDDETDYIEACRRRASARRRASRRK